MDVSFSGFLSNLEQIANTKLKSALTFHLPPSSHHT